jgi:uncharacterized membrane protein
MKKLILASLIVLLLLSTLPFSAAQAADGVIRAVLFYSPTCGHCEYVITEVIPPLFEQYGRQLFIIGIDISQADGQALFAAALQHFKVESAGVPFLVIGDTYLVGSKDIPEQFPVLIEQYLAQGGVDWPAIPGVAEAMIQAEANANASATATAQAASPSEPEATLVPTAIPVVLNTEAQAGGLGSKFANDLAGNSLAVLVLLGMLVVLGLAIRSLKQSQASETKATWKWAVPVLCLAGLGVAGYLAYVETTQVQAVCGPVGDCNTVQQSEYARLFGVLPIGILGLVGYLLILAAWGLAQAKKFPLSAYGAVAQLGLAAFGVLFSIYLTFLEPFVIGATCAWCLTSAVLITLLMWLSLPAGRQAWEQLKQS